MELANRYAPEHLVLAVEGSETLSKQVQNAGAIFLGHYTPVAVGDYLAGPNHVLPTGGTARFFSPLGVEDFLKRMSVIRFEPRQIPALRRTRRLLRLRGGDHEEQHNAGRRAAYLTMARNAASETNDWKLALRGSCRLFAGLSSTARRMASSACVLRPARR